MKTRYAKLLLVLVGMLLTSSGLHAQSLDDQLLIFRNTGETNLVFQSELDSITMTNVDAAGVEHDMPVAQLFHTADTILYVPIAEIDSVCVGSRNQIEFNPGVKVLAENPDMQWIVRVDGNNIYYKTTTPNAVLPTEGQKLYFAEQTELFPYGLCAKVDKVVRGDSEIVVSVSSIDATEIFQRFFYAGTFEGVKPEMTKASRITRPIDNEATLGFSLELGDTGETSVSGTIGVHGKVVIDLRKKYYHVNANISNTLYFSINAKAKESKEGSFSKDFLHIPLATVAGVLFSSIDVGLFADLNAELSFGYDMERKVTTRIDWTNNKGVQSFNRSNPTEEGCQTNEAKLQVTLDGSVFFGLSTSLNLMFLDDVAGARAVMKLGPEFSGELGMSLLNNLSKNYDVSLHGKAELSLKNKFAFEGYSIHRRYLIVGEEIESKFFEYEHVLSERKIDLFPKFFAARAVVAPKKKDVTVAVKTKNEIAHKVDAGFELLKNKPTPEIEATPVDSVFVKDIEVKEENVVQGVDAEMDIPQSVNVDNVVLRPVFHYAGYTIPSEFIEPAQDPSVEPVIFSMSNGAATVVSGMPVVGSRIIDETMYSVGPFVPVAVNDTVFHEVSPFAGVGEGFGYIYYEDSESLVGNWIGTINGESVAISFDRNGKCNFKLGKVSMPDANYNVNEPQSGQIKIEDADGYIVLEIVSLQASSLKLKVKNSQYKGCTCTLSKT